MKAVTYQGMKNIKVKDVEDAHIQKPDDVIVRITTTAICGSDLHIYNGEIPNMPNNFIIGHEPMGVVEEVGTEVTRVKKGDRVIIPFNVACGRCWFCENQLESQCDNSNEFLHGDTGGYFGYSETYGGYAGGQAELLRVPFGNSSIRKFRRMSRWRMRNCYFYPYILPTAYWSVDNAGVKPR